MLRSAPVQSMLTEKSDRERQPHFEARMGNGALMASCSASATVSASRASGSTTRLIRPMRRASILVSVHTGQPVRLPITATRLRIAPVRIGEGADVGVGVIILPGVSIGRHAIVGAGAVVAEDVPDYGIVAGVPATALRYRRTI